MINNYTLAMFSFKVGFKGDALYVIMKSNDKTAVVCKIGKDVSITVTTSIPIPVPISEWKQDKMISKKKVINNEFVKRGM